MISHRCDANQRRRWDEALELRGRQGMGWRGWKADVPVAGRGQRYRAVRLVPGFPWLRAGREHSWGGQRLMDPSVDILKIDPGASAAGYRGMATGRPARAQMPWLGGAPTKSRSWRVSSSCGARARLQWSFEEDGPGVLPAEKRAAAMGTTVRIARTSPGWGCTGCCIAGGITRFIRS